MSNFLFLSGSTPDNFNQTEDIRNPLPPCPDSPNCVRISRKLPYNKDVVFKASIAAIDQMDALEKKLLEDPLRISAVFKVFIYKDDFTVLLEEDGNDTAYLHLRSSSRIGYSDLGVNRRRVKRFLKKLNKALGNEKAKGSSE